MARGDAFELTPAGLLHSTKSIVAEWVYGNPGGVPKRETFFQPAFKAVIENACLNAVALGPDAGACWIVLAGSASHSRPGTSLSIVDEVAAPGLLA